MESYELCSELTTTGQKRGGCTFPIVSQLHGSGIGAPAFDTIRLHLSIPCAVLAPHCGAEEAQRQGEKYAQSKTWGNFIFVKPINILLGLIAVATAAARRKQRSSKTLECGRDMKTLSTYRLQFSYSEMGMMIVPSTFLLCYGYKVFSTLLGTMPLSGRS